MRRIYNDKSHDPRQWTTRKLKENFAALYVSIDSLDCFGVQDLALYEVINRELGRRNVTITTAAILR